MKRAIIYVFSGTGNTLRIANLYKDEFQINSIHSDIYKIDSTFKDIPNSTDYDFVGIAYPIHAFNAPKIILDFAKRLPKAENKKYFIITTSGEPLRLNNAASSKLISILKKKGYMLANEYFYIMPYNMIFRHSNSMVNRMWTAAKQLCPIDIAEIINREKKTLKKSFISKIVSKVLRIEQLAMRINGKFFKVDYNKCIHCKKCIENCPTYNIKFIDGKYKFGNNCIMCSRCSMNCPKDAISIAILNSWKVNAPYDFDNLSNDNSKSDKHKNYCQKAYEKYFSNVDKKQKDFEIKG